MYEIWSYANEGLCLSSPDEKIRDAAVARLGDYIRQAAHLGAVLVVGLMQGLRSDEPDENIAHRRIVGRDHGEPEAPGCRISKTPRVRKKQTSNAWKKLNCPSRNGT